jgi:hypothetical protein
MEDPLQRLLISSRSVNKHGCQRRLWPPCLLTDQIEMSILFRGPSIDATYQVSVHLAMRC